MEKNPLSSTRCFILDMDGTFYLDDHLLPGAAEFLPLLRSRGIRYLFLTNNSSRSKAEYVQKLRRLGIEVVDEDIFTSGEATALYLQSSNPGARVFLMGTPTLAQEFAEHGFNLVDERPDFAVLGFDTTLTYDRLWKMCDLVRAGVPYIATHPDINCPTKDGYMPDIGAMMACIEASTGRRPDVVIGKPNPPIVAAVMEKTRLPVTALAMVGDRLYTDIAMGQTGITTVLVLSGETRAEEIPASPFQPDLVVANLAELAKWIP
jgi:HAD superfamily hydrolase (TIGR01457 family)